MRPCSYFPFSPNRLQRLFVLQNITYNKKRDSFLAESKTGSVPNAVIFDGSQRESLDSSYMLTRKRRDRVRKGTEVFRLEHADSSAAELN